MTATCVAGNGTTLAVPTAGYAVWALKNNYQNLVYSIEIILNGKTIHDHQSFINIYSN